MRERAKIGKAIFYGNGINLISGGLKWNDLFDGQNGKRYSFIKSNTLHYEAMYLTGNIKPYKDDMPSQNTTEFENKKQIAERTNAESKSNCIYSQLAKLPFTEYLTTNYDHAFEEALRDEGYEPVNKRKETENIKAEITYSIYRQKTFLKGNSEKRIWHIHGDVDKPRSIQLGYDHYCKSLSQICNYINTQFAPKGKSSSDSAMKDEKILNLREGTSAVKSWIDILFAFDVYFIGYGLSFDEIDIWWILNKRQRFFKERKLENLGNIYFYEPYDNENNQTKEKEELLKVFGAQTKFEELKGGTVDINDQYKDFYKTTLDNIVKSDIKNNNLKTTTK